jgi:hypothetical protein
MGRRVRKAILAIDGVVESPGIFGTDDAFWVNGKEIGYFQNSGENWGLRVTKREISARRSELKKDDRVVLKPSSDWLHIRVSKPRDCALAVELARVAADANRPPPDTPAKLPPTGARLERMRRFH